MKTFKEAVENTFEWDQEGRWSLILPNGYELTLEPLLFDHQHYIALYDKDKNLLLNDKIPIIPGKI